VLLPDGESLVCFSLEGDTDVWDIASRRRKPRLTLPGAAVAGAVTADGRYLFTASRGSELTWSDLADGTPQARFDGIGPLADCAASPDGRTVVAGEDTGRVHLLRLVAAPRSGGGSGR